MKRARLIFILIACLGLILLSVGEAYAQSGQSASGKPKKRTNIDFEDQLVQDEVKKPELFYLLQKKQFNFGKLIRLRENFIPEMQKTSEDIEKAGGP